MNYEQLRISNEAFQSSLALAGVAEETLLQQ
jgi:hypothetical protein